MLGDGLNPQIEIRVLVKLQNCHLQLPAGDRRGSLLWKVCRISTPISWHSRTILLCCERRQAPLLLLT